MMIKNPNGYINNSDIKILDFPFKAFNVKTTDIIIKFKLRDNTELVTRIPVASLRAASAYASIYIDPGEEMMIDLLSDIHAICKAYENLYNKLSISIVSHQIRFVEGESI